MKKAATGIDCQVCPFLTFRNSAMMSALLSGASARIGCWLRLKRWPSRVKMQLLVAGLGEPR